MVSMKFKVCYNTNSGFADVHESGLSTFSTVRPTYQIQLCPASDTSAYRSFSSIARLRARKA
jgi:hypothetical protein